MNLRRNRLGSSWGDKVLGNKGGRGVPGDGARVVAECTPRLCGLGRAIPKRRPAVGHMQLGACSWAQAVGRRPSMLAAGARSLCGCSMPVAARSLRSHNRPRDAWFRATTEAGLQAAGRAGLRPDRRRETPLSRGLPMRFAARLAGPGSGRLTGWASGRLAELSCRPGCRYGPADPDSRIPFRVRFPHQPACS